MSKRKELKAIRAEFDQRTAHVSDDVWDLRDFAMLLNMADNAHLGKTKAIIYAFKLGYLARETESRTDESNLYIRHITEISKEIEKLNPDALIKIYTVARTYLRLSKGEL